MPRNMSVFVAFWRLNRRNAASADRRKSISIYANRSILRIAEVKISNVDSITLKSYNSLLIEGTRGCSMPASYSISGITVVAPDGFVENGVVRIQNGRLSENGEQDRFDLRPEKGLMLYPALINVHDHLRGNYLPRVGPPPGSFYLKCADWINDLNESESVKERASLTAEECYLLSSYKNLFSGVVTVNDHFPHRENQQLIPKLPVRVIERYTLAHEATSYSLDWGDGIETEHSRAVDQNCPFIIHLEEGFDEEYQAGVELLEGLGSLDEHSVLVHCLGFSEQDIEKVRDKGCTVVWCPGSNFFMFNVTCKIRRILMAGINCALGTDSTHSGTLNLLEEIRFARDMYAKMYGEVLDGRTIFEMVTINPAKAFRMDKEIGSIDAGKFADLMLLKPNHSEPYEALASAQIEDIELLTWEGTPIYGAREYKDFFKLDPGKYTDIKIRGHEKFVVGDPASLLRLVREKVGFKKELAFIPLDD